MFNRGLAAAALAAVGFSSLLVHAASAADRVNVMPDRQVRPGVVLPVFGAACTGAACPMGTGTANGEAYSWAFSFNGADVSVNGDVSGNLVTGPGVVATDRFIVENTTFVLQGGATRAIVTAELTVGGTTSLPLTIDVVDPTDPISLAPLAGQAIDVNIAIDEALRYLYLSQEAGTGAWRNAIVSVPNDCGTTAFAVWAMSNAGHPPTNPSTDLYAEFVQRGVDFILGLGQLQPVIAQPNIGNPDADLNGRLVSLCGSTLGQAVSYANPIATAGLIAAYSGNPASLLPGPIGIHAAGTSYAQIAQDAIDMIAFAQYDTANIARGGWRYTPNDFADTSSDGWNYVAMEGLEQVFGGTVLPLVKGEVEERLDASQCDAGADLGKFPYATGSNCEAFAGQGEGTTGGGLSGLVLVSSGGYSPTKLDGGVLSNAVFPDVASRKAAAVAHIGEIFSKPAGLDPTSACWDGTNRSNPYAMWVTARALRLNGTELLTDEGGFTFDWETGETPPASGTVAAPGSEQEGYFALLVRQQESDGAWRKNSCPYYDDNLETALDLLVLLPTVFGPPQPPTGPDLAFDAHPTSCRNPINIRSRGVTPMAILNNAPGFDLGQIQTETIRLYWNDPANFIQPTRWDLEDVATPYDGNPAEEPLDPQACTTDGPDGLTDLTLKFDTGEIADLFDNTVQHNDPVLLTITFELTDGTTIELSDVMVVLRRGGPNG